MAAFLIHNQFHIRPFLSGFLKIEAGDWSTQNVKDSMVAPALEYIEKNLANEITNPILARLCCLSEDHFARRCREIIGETPGQFVRNRRVAIASQELLFSADSIEEIATHAGFCNRFYFSRVFASEMGMPPAAYRKMTRP